MIFIFIISYIVLALLLISYIVTILKTKKNNVFAIGYAKMSWDNAGSYLFLAIIILNIILGLARIANHEDWIDFLIELDSDAWSITHYIALAAEAKVWVVACLFLLYIWFAALLKNIGLFTKNGVYFLVLSSPKSSLLNCGGSALRLWWGASMNGVSVFGVPKRTWRNLKGIL